MTATRFNGMWGRRYARDTYAYGTEPNDFLRQSATSLPVGRTLCIGEGEGRNAVYLASLQPELQGLEITHGVETRRDIHEGEFHRDRGAVVQVIAVRR